MVQVTPPSVVTSTIGSKVSSEEIAAGAGSDAGDAKPTAIGEGGESEGEGIDFVVAEGGPKDADVAVDIGISTEVIIHAGGQDSIVDVADAPGVGPGNPGVSIHGIVDANDAGAFPSNVCRGRVDGDGEGATASEEPAAVVGFVVTCIHNVIWYCNALDTVPFQRRSILKGNRVALYRRREGAVKPWGFPMPVDPENRTGRGCASAQPTKTVGARPAIAPRAFVPEPGRGVPGHPGVIWRRNRSGGHSPAAGSPRSR